MTIILDLDDVLANLRESLYQVMHRVTRIDKHWRDWTHYDLREHYQVDNAFLDDVLMRERALESCQPEPGAAAMTQALAELGCELVIITARGWHPQAHELTQDWLKQHGMRHDHLHVTQLGGNKLDVLTATTTPADSILLAVDDHPNNLQRYRQAGIPTLMPSMPWNAQYHDAPRIHDLQAVVDYTQRRLAGSET